MFDVTVICSSALENIKEPTNMKPQIIFSYCHFLVLLFYLH